MDPLSKDDIIKINVGGKLYMTTFHLICRYRNSHLYELIYEKLKDKNNDNVESREIFIDRNGKRFEYILDFLRDGVLICENDINLLVKILIEAIYFKIVALIKILKKKIDLLYSKLDSSVNRKILKSIFTAIEKNKIIKSEAEETKEKIFDKSNTLTNPVSEYEKLKFLRFKKKKKRHNHSLDLHDEKRKERLNKENGLIKGFETDEYIKVKEEEEEEEKEEEEEEEEEDEELGPSYSVESFQKGEEAINNTKINEIEKEVVSCKNDSALKKNAKNIINNESCNNDNNNNIHKNSNKAEINLTNMNLTNMNITNEKINLFPEKCITPMFCEIEDFENHIKNSYNIKIHNDSCNNNNLISTTNNTTNNNINSSNNIYNNASDIYCNIDSFNDNVKMKTKSLFLSPNREYFKNPEVKSVSFSEINHTLFFNKYDNELPSDDSEERLNMQDISPTKTHLKIPINVHNNDNRNDINGNNATRNIIIYDDVNNIEETSPPPMVSNINLGEQIFSTTVDF